MFAATKKSDSLMRCFTLTLLAVLLAAAVAAAQDGKIPPAPAAGDGCGPDGTGAKDDPGWEPDDAIDCSFFKKSFAAIRDADASAYDLQVAIDWADDPATPPQAQLHLLDEQGATVTTLGVVAAPGTTTTHVLPLALAGAAVHGPQYRLALVDPYVTPTVPIAPAFDFRLTFDCSSGSCVFRVVDGLRAGWVAISDELMLAIDGAEAASSSDILGDVVTAEPSLKGEVLSLAWQLGRLDAAHDLDAAPCTCLWVPAQGTTPDEENLPTFYENSGPLPSTNAPPSYGTAGQQGPGAAYELAMQHTGGTVTTDLPAADPPGFSRVIMDLRCWAFSGWAPPAGGGKALAIEIPKISPCAAACNAEFNHQAEVWGTMEAEAWASSTLDASANADFAAHWGVDNRDLFEAAGALTVAAPPAGATTDLTCTHKAGDQQVAGFPTWTGLRSASTLTTGSTVSAQAGPGGWAYAMSDLGYWLESTGKASCTVEPMARIWLSNLSIAEGGDGVLMERWGP